MKTRYKFIHFARLTRTDWICRNNKTNDILGGVEFYKAWRQHVFTASGVAVFSVDCLLDIADFLKQLKAENVVHAPAVCGCARPAQPELCPGDSAG